MKLKPPALFSILFGVVFAPAMAMAQPMGQSAWQNAHGIMGEENVLAHRLMASHTQATAGQTLGVAWQFTLQPGWHIYWQNAGDSGLPPELKLGPAAPKASQKAEVLPLTFPAPTVVVTPPIINYAYHGQVTLGTQLTLPPTLAKGPHTLNFAAEFLYCKDVCLPGTASLTLPITIADAPQPNPAYSSPSVPQPWPFAALKATTDGRTAALSLPFIAEGWRFFPATDGLIDDSAPQRAQGQTLLIILDTTTSSPPSPALEGLLVNEAQDKAYTVNAPLTHQSTPLPLPTATPQAPAATGPWGLVAAMGGAFLAGLILNLMPCVLPVLSLKVLGLIRHHHSRTRRRHSLAYTGGVIFSFWALAGAIGALKAAGASLGWGFHLQEPLVVGALVLLMLALALNFWGVFSVGESLTRLGAKPARTGTEPLWASAATGALAVVVATPCTVPFMGAAMGYALTHTWGAGLAIFTALGLGMALPFVLVAFAPRTLKGLPKPGPWMDTLKQFLGWPMLLTGLWLAYVFQSLTGQVATFTLLAGATGMAFGLWLWGRNPTRLRAIGCAVIVGLTLTFIHPLGQPTPPAWEPFSAERVSEAQAQGRPVFIDFTADWCLTCKVTEATVLNTQTVQALFKAHNVRTLKADWTTRDDAITAELAKHGRQGVPLYLLYNPNSPEPTLLPQLLTPALLKGALEDEPPQENALAPTAL